MIRILPPARLEIEEAIAWYEAQSRGLGAKFRQEFVHGLRRVRDFPKAWHPLRRGIRRYRLARFPYGIIYVQDGEEVVILAVSHLHRAPMHWRDRLQGS